MYDININKAYSNFVVALLLLFPVVIGSVKIIGNLILLILVFMGFYILLKEKKSPFIVPGLKLFSWLTFGYFVVMLLSVLQNEGFVDDLYHLGRKAHFALAPLIALAIYRVKLPLNKLLLSIKIGLIIIGIIVIYQYLSGVNRPSGMFNANIFGDITVIMFFMSIANFVNESSKNKFFTIFAAILGLSGIILSQNKGSWLVFVILLLIYCWFYYWHSQSSKRISIVLLVLFIISGTSITITDNYISSRISNTMENAKDWQLNTPVIVSPDTNPSAGERFRMWSAGLSAAKDSPWTGYGYRNATTEAQKYTEQEIQFYTHLHNEYVTNLVSAGIFGLLSVLALLFLPLRVFLKSVNNNKIYVISLMGILLCSGYAFIGLTHIAFGEEHINAVYIYFLGLLLPKVIANES